jgi:hypothetical protein
MVRKAIITDGNYVKMAVDCYNLDDDGTFGHIGKMYKFENVKATIKQDCYDEADLHYFRKNPKKLEKGTEVTINVYWINFYGSYYRITHEGKTYDIKRDNVLFNIKKN